MFFIASKVFFFLLNPLTWVVGLLLLALFSRSEKLRKMGLISGTMLLIVFTNPLLSNYAMSRWEYPPTPKDEIPLVHTGVVLGGILEIGRPGPDQYHFNESAERINEALVLFRDGVIRNIILSGGSGSVFGQTEKESILLKEYAATLLGASITVLLDTVSRNTYENAVQTALILKNLQINERPVLLITSASHMRRALACFQRQGIEVIPYPVDYHSAKVGWNPVWILPSYGPLEQWNILIKEWVGYAAYRATGYL